MHVELTLLQVCCILAAITTVIFTRHNIIKVLLLLWAVITYLALVLHCILLTNHQTLLLIKVYSRTLWTRYIQVLVLLFLVQKTLAYLDRNQNMPILSIHMHRECVSGLCFNVLSNYCVPSVIQGYAWISGLLNEVLAAVTYSVELLCQCKYCQCSICCCLQFHMLASILAEEQLLYFPTWIFRCRRTRG